MSSHRVTVLFVGIIILQGAAVRSLYAQCELQKLNADLGAPREYLGYSIDIFGDALVVGAPNNTQNGALSGAAYVYRFNGSEWVQEATLFPAQAGAGQLFGTSVAVHGDSILVGVPNATLDSGLLLAGAADVFRYSGSQWLREATLVPAGSATYALFAWSTDISDGVAVAGAPRAWGVFGFGAVSVFRFDGSGWIEEAVLAVGDPSHNSGFGRAVRVDGDVVVVGAYRDADAGPRAGAVFVFRYDGSAWVEEAKLIPADLGANEEFGRAVDISGNTLLVGAPRDDDNGSRSGSAYAYAFDGSQWVEEAKLLPVTGGPEEYFGYSVALSGDTAVVGAHFDGENGPQSGAAYVFRFDGDDWTQEAKLVSSAGAAGDYLGRSVAISGTTLAVGAPRDDDQGTHSGAAYLFGSCPKGTVAADSAPHIPVEPQGPKTRALVLPAQGHRGAVRARVSGEAASPAELVREDSYTQFVNELLLAHFGDDRGIYGPEHDLAREKIVATLSGYGLSVTLEAFTYSGETYHNIVGTKLGTTFPDQEYIIGAHYDSPSNGGGDDNASGVALLLEAARVLSGYDAQRTIRFIAFDAEEAGLVGSKAYVDDHLDDNILGVFSADMVAYNNGENLVQVGCGPASLLLEGLLAQAVAEYGEGLGALLFGQHYNTDHAPFEAAGFQGCAFRERGLTPYYHTPLDNVDMTGTLDMAYATRMTRIAVGFLVDNAGVDTCVPADLIVRPPEATDANRFLTFTPTNAGMRTAIRVRLARLYDPDPVPPFGKLPNFAAYEGAYRWVGPPVELPEFDEAGPPFAEPTWMGARLQCEPYFADWGALGTALNVYGAEVMPDSTYELQTILEVCSDPLDDESLYSVPVEITTARWGDVTELYAAPDNSPQPDFIDISSIVTKFRNSLTPSKVAAMLRFNVPPVSEKIDFRDIAACVAGFVAEPYSQDGPCVCPSTATCPDLDVCGRCSP